MTHTLFEKVQSKDRIHWQLDSKTTGVLNKEDPSVEIERAIAEGSNRRDILHGAVTFKFVVISFGSIVADKVNDNTGGKGHNGRDNANGTPSSFWGILIFVVKNFKDW